MSKKRTRRSAQQWRSLVEKQHDSGLSAPAFCKTQGIAYQSFMTWRKRLAASDRSAVVPDSSFIELTPSAGTEPGESTAMGDMAPAASMPTCIELSLGGGIELRITRTA
ncbi:MAG: hypothetical protein KAG66_11460 [Methylococcales bacterium]|nr:hypothetical protein [Methylococcales bacterium]